MIPILYEKDETAFVSNGLGRLRDCISCVVTEERNGIYECDFEYPITGRNFELIQCGRIIACEHDESGDIQPFDIVSYTKPIDGVVTFHAVHISYRMRGMVATGSSVQTLSGAFTALEAAQPENPFSYWSDITPGTGYVSAFDGTPKAVRSYLGGVEGSILDTFGGEYEWDRFNVRLWSARGQLRNVTIRYGLNLTDYNEEMDYSDVYTSAVPYWAGGETPVVGDLVSSGATSYSGREITAALDLSDKFESQPTKAQVEAMAETYMGSNQPYLPGRTITVSFVNLMDTDQYDLVAPLERCNLCDSVRVVLPKYGIDTTFKIVKTVYNVLLERYNEIELGRLSTSLAEALGVSPGGGATGGGDVPTEILARLAALEVEYVQEYGTSGSWYYRKYNTGRFEAWLRISTTVTLNTALANATGWYRNASAYTLTVPSAVGSSITVTHADIHPITGLASTMAVVTALSGATVSYYIISPAASASSIASRATTMTAYVQGTWS